MHKRIEQAKSVCAVQTLSCLPALVEDHALIAVDVGVADHDFQLLIAHDRIAALCIELINRGADGGDGCRFQPRAVHRFRAHLNIHLYT